MFFLCCKRRHIWNISCEMGAEKLDDNSVKPRMNLLAWFLCSWVIGKLPSTFSVFAIPWPLSVISLGPKPPGSLYLKLQMFRLSIPAACHIQCWILSRHIIWYLAAFNMWQSLSSLKFFMWFPGFSSPLGLLLSPAYVFFSDTYTLHIHTYGWTYSPGRILASIWF